MTPTTEQMTTALRNARIGLAMWGMGTQEIDALIGPMSEEDRVLARAGRGGPLWDDGSEPAAMAMSSSDHEAIAAISQAFTEMEPGMSGPFDECQMVGVIRPDDNQTVLITHKEVIGHMAHWAIRQHPFGRPEGLFEITDAITKAAQDWPEGISSLKMCRFDGWPTIERWLRLALDGNPVLTQWNTPRSQHTKSVFVSRYGGPLPEDDFIDIDALLRNVALAVWREALAEQ